MEVVPKSGISPAMATSSASSSLGGDWGNELTSMEPSARRRASSGKGAAKKSSAVAP